MTVVFSALTVVIALGVALIALMQYLLARRKLRLDLFDKRFAVYEAVLDQIREALKQRNWPEATDREFLRHLETARFLFPAEIAEYMTGIRAELIEFATNAEAAADTPVTDPERAGFLKLRREGLKRLREEYPKVQAVFVPHMRV